LEDVLMDNGIQLDEIRGIIRRRLKSFIIVFFAVIFIAAVIALAWPPSYLSKATILVESQQIPQDYVKSAITTYVEERLEVIKQQVMSRSKLQEIIDQFGLYSDDKERYTSSEIIDEMRKDINLETISANVIDERTGRESQATIAFTLSYEGGNPTTVQKVANKLASLYLEQNIRSRSEQVSNTTTFLEQEMAGLQTKVDDIQAKISAFKSAHYGALPESNSLNLNSMTQLERQLDQNKAQVTSLKERKIYLEGQLANINPSTSFITTDGKSAPDPQERLKYLRTELTSLKGVYNASHPDIIRIEKTIKELESETAGSEDNKDLAKRLEELTNQRASMMEKLTPQHPDVIRLDKEIQTLTDQLKKADTKQIIKGTGTEEPDNPAYINIRTQIKTAEMDIETLLKEQNVIEAELGLYQKRMESSPLIEQEYNNLTRDLETSKFKYNEIMNKLLEARVAQGMEEKQKGERFTIIDNAQLPEKPSKPNRLAIALIGFVLAVGGAVGLAAFQESMDDSFKTPVDLARFIKVPVLSAMPCIVSNEELQKGKTRMVIIGAGALCVIILAIVLVHFYVMPMDILLAKIQQRMRGL
jgi:polysaccharide biosynthesis transport protein